MPKEVLVYTPIYDYSAERFITALDSMKRDDIMVRVSSDGGSPESAFGMIAKMKEHQGRVDVGIDGRARSMAAFLPCYATGKVTALDTSEFLFHRASYGQYVESSPELMTEARKQSLKGTNDDLRAAFESKINAEAFQRVTGKSVDELFSLDSRIDVRMTAAQAKEVGLVDEIINITPIMKAAIDANFVRMAADYGLAPEIVAEVTPEPVTQTTIKINKMTIADLKANHPELVAAVITEERDRVGALLAFADVDLEKVKAAITAGENLTQTLSAEFTRKAIAQGGLKALEEGGAPAVETTTVTKEATADEVALEAFREEVRKGVPGLK